MVQYAHRNIMLDNAPIWQQAWERAVGTATVIRTNDSLDRMVTHLGYQSVSVEPSVKDAFGGVIKTDEQLVKEMAEKLSEAETILDSRLIPQQLAHLELARAIARDFVGAGSVKAAIIPPASDAVARTAGLYEFGTAMIKIHTAMLHSAGDTIGVMVHELGHHVAFMRTNSKEKAGDLTPEHAAAMEYVAGRIFKALAEGKYDEYLKKVTW